MPERKLSKIKFLRTINMTKYINSIKGVSSKILFQEFPEINKQCNRENAQSAKADSRGAIAR